MALQLDEVMMEMSTGYVNDVILQMETIEDSFEKSIARYDYPYADGADLEDMGQKAHSIKIRCYFWDDEDNETYDDHKFLLDSLKGKDLLDFIHPKYGLMQGKIESIIVQHDDRERCAVLDITFVEHGRIQLEAPAPQIPSAVEMAYIKAQEEQEEILAEDIAEEMPEDAGALSKLLDSAIGILDQVQEYSNKMRGFVSQVEGYIATAEAVVNQVLSPVNSLQATITYGLNLPGRILGPITGAVEKVALLYTSLKNSPRQFLANLDSAFDDLMDAFSAFGSRDTSAAGQAALEIMSTHLEIACAQRLALEAAVIYAQDNLAAADTTADPDFQVMNINELEFTLDIVRTRLEAAIEKARAMESLKTMAVTLLNHVNNVRLEREKMVAVILDNPMPLHLVCLKYGLPYNDAERLIRVNNIPAPNFTQGEVMIYVR